MCFAADKNHTCVTFLFSFPGRFRRPPRPPGGERRRRGGGAPHSGDRMRRAQPNHLANIIVCFKGPPGRVHHPHRDRHRQQPHGDHGGGSQVRSDGPLPRQDTHPLQGSAVQVTTRGKQEHSLCRELRNRRFNTIPQTSSPPQTTKAT